jgi:outer membrane protein assembly factor BamB
LSIHVQYDGTIYLGTSSGYYKFNASIANSIDKPDKVLITNFVAGGKEIAYERELGIQ